MSTLAQQVTLRCTSEKCVRRSGAPTYLDDGGVLRECVLSFGRLTHSDVFDVTSPENDVLVNLLSWRGRPVCGTVFSTKGPHLGVESKAVSCCPQPGALNPPLVLKLPSIPKGAPSTVPHGFPCPTTLPPPTTKVQWPILVVKNTRKFWVMKMRNKPRAWWSPKCHFLGRQHRRSPSPQVRHAHVSGGRLKNPTAAFRASTRPSTPGSLFSEKPGDVVAHPLHTISLGGALSEGAQNGTHTTRFCLPRSFLGHEPLPVGFTEPNQAFPLQISGA